MEAVERPWKLPTSLEVASTKAFRESFRGNIMEVSWKLSLEASMEVVEAPTEVASAESPTTSMEASMKAFVEATSMKAFAWKLPDILVPWKLP